MCMTITVAGMKVLRRKEKRVGDGENSFWPLAVLWMQKEFLIKAKYASE